MIGRPDRVLLGVSLKLYLAPDAAAAWARRVADTVREHPAVLEGRAELFVLPALPALDRVRRVFEGLPIAVGAQDLSPHDRGAFTGAVSGADLVAVGCVYAEIGHAERRRFFGEDDVSIGTKLAAATRNGLTPVLCLGERTRADAQAAIAECTVRLDAVLASAGGEVPDIVIAYEPEWAIGAADAADPDHVDAVCAGIRSHLRDRPAVGAARIIYGGGAQPGLLPRLGPAVDGLFLGRFAHDPAALGAILDETLAVR